MTDQVIVTDDGPVRLIRMNRPEKKNALTSAMYDAMAEAIETASGNSPIRCIVIAGVPGAEAKASGLINQVAPAGDVEAEAMKAAQQIAALPLEGVALSRRLMKGAADEVVKRIDEEAAAFKQRLGSPEAREAFAAFFAR